MVGPIKGSGFISQEPGFEKNWRIEIANQIKKQFNVDNIFSNPQALAAYEKAINAKTREIEQNNISYYGSKTLPGER